MTLSQGCQYIRSDVFAIGAYPHPFKGRFFHQADMVFEEQAIDIVAVTDPTQYPSAEPGRDTVGNRGPHFIPGLQQVREIGERIQSRVPVARLLPIRTGANVVSQSGGSDRPEFRADDAAGHQYSMHFGQTAPEVQQVTGESVFRVKCELPRVGAAQVCLKTGRQLPKERDMAPARRFQHDAIDTFADGRGNVQQGDLVPRAQAKVERATPEFG